MRDHRGEFTDDREAGGMRQILTRFLGAFAIGNVAADSLAVALDIFHVLEDDKAYLSTNPKGEPQLGRRGLYRAMGGLSDVGAHEMAMLWVLNLSDGRHRLLEIAERSDYPFDIVQRVARMLMEHGLLNEIGSEVSNG